MEEALRTRLLATAGLTALVGQRVDWGGRATGAALPCVTLHRIGGERGIAHDGPLTETESRVQVDCWGRTYAAAKLISRQVAALHGLKAALSGVDFYSIFLVGERDFQDQDDDGAVHRVSLDFMIWHEEI